MGERGNHRRVRIFHNLDSYARLCGYLPGNTVVEVFAYVDNSDTLATALDNAYELFSLGGPDPRAMRYREAGHRPLSVGDIVACDDQFHSWNAFGWSPIDPPAIDHASRHANDQGEMSTV